MTTPEERAPGQRAPSDTAFDLAAAASQRRLAETDRRRAAAFLRSAYRDELTGALHRRPGRQRLQTAVRRAQQSSKPLCIAFFDVDNLKAVNDREGHLSGDKLLAATGRALQMSLRSGDLIVRYGGDEFVCAMQAVSKEEAIPAIDRVATALAELFPGAHVSAGCAQVSQGDSLDDLIGRADADLYGRRHRRRHSDDDGVVPDGAEPDAGAQSGSVACGACGERIGLPDFVLVGGPSVSRVADCPACGESTVISLA